MEDFVLALVSGATSCGEECSGLAAVRVPRHWGAKVVFSWVCTLARLIRIPFGLACTGGLMGGVRRRVWAGGVVYIDRPVNK